MSTGGFIGADDRDNVVLDLHPLEDSHWICQATKDFDVKRVHFKNIRQGGYLTVTQDGRWTLGPGPDESKTGFDLELLKTISGSVMRQFEFQSKNGRADSQVFTEILHRQIACFVTYNKDMGNIGTMFEKLRLLDDESLLDVQCRTYHAVTTKVMKELPLLSDRLFKFLDINDDNTLTKNEFEIILSLFPQGSDGADGNAYESLFQIMDVDDTGIVVREEVVEFFRALLTCMVDFVHMAVDINKKTVNQIFIPKLVDVLFESLDANHDGSVSLSEAQGFLEEVMHRDPDFRDSLIQWQYTFFGISSDPSNASASKEQLKKEGEILQEILNLVGTLGMSRESFLDMMSHLGDNALSRLVLNTLI